jgi:hypothetical protein
MFDKETDMTIPVVDWMKSDGMTVKPEFRTPWGICDLVSLKFNAPSVAHRLSLGQNKAVSSTIRAALLLQIPDYEKGKYITINKLAQQFMPFVTRDVIEGQVAQLINDRFVIQCSRGRLQKKNGWMPLYSRFVAVELKLTRIEEAMCQALSNLGFAEESYVGLPCKIAKRVASNISRWAEFFDAGIGLLGITQRNCKVIMPASPKPDWKNYPVQFYCIEKFWRTRIKD